MPKPIHDPGGDTIVKPDVEVQRPDLQPEEGDHDRFAHHVPRDELMEALVNGTPVTALCGKTWVPSRDPKRYPVCPTCQELRERLDDFFGKGGDGGGDGDGGDS